MIQKVADILKPLNVPVQYILRPNISGNSRIGISYHFFNEGYNLYSDGEGKEFGGILQVDIFSTMDYSDVVKQTIELLQNNGFRLAYSGDNDDSFSNVKYYHKVLRFNYVEKEVLGNV